MLFRSFTGDDGVVDVVGQAAGIDNGAFAMTGVRADRSGIAHFDLRWPGDRSVVFEDDVKVKQCVRNIFGRENAAAVFVRFAGRIGVGIDEFRVEPREGAARGDIRRRFGRRAGVFNSVRDGRGASA